MIDHLFSGNIVKIDQDITAKNEVKITAGPKLFPITEIDMFKRHHIFDLIRDFEDPGLLGEIAS